MCVCTSSKGQAKDLCRTRHADMEQSFVQNTQRHIKTEHSTLIVEITIKKNECMDIVFVYIYNVWCI